MKRDTLRKAGKAAGVGVVGAGVGAAGVTVADDSPSEEKVQNLQDKLSERPTQEEVAELEAELDSLEDRPTKAEYAQLQNKLSQRFTQEEVDEIVADATQREVLVDYLPVLVDEEIELKQGDVSAEHDVDAEDHELEDHVNDVTDEDFDESDLDNEEFDELRAVYRHDDGHNYEVLVRTFDDRDDAEEYGSELEKAVEFADYEDELEEDAHVYSNGDTVVYLYGHANVDDYDTYDFEAVKGQY